ncbi:DEAD-box ATP-dependent RNA helicase 52C [Artemisia annua]|uniref:DEAD-box ATP-dependent RNA helicase 52C n=1 Tax=Artemisia annua TaxID=35608 RepID=A0A2U1LGH1_ARTAN|nr:DEAD-box ATP-dependent RNA helicase 52C [Artemisia annua]
MIRRTNVKVVVEYGGTPVYNQLRSFERDVDILVTTPGRPTDMIERSKYHLKRIKYLPLDAADRMLDVGFEPQIRKIVERMDTPPPSRRQTMLFSATYPSEVQPTRLYGFYVAGTLYVKAACILEGNHDQAPFGCIAFGSIREDSLKGNDNAIL